MRKSTNRRMIKYKWIKRRVSPGGLHLQKEPRKLTEMESSFFFFLPSFLPEKSLLFDCVLDVRCWIPGGRGERMRRRHFQARLWNWSWSWRWQTGRKRDWTRERGRGDARGRLAKKEEESGKEEGRGKRRKGGVVGKRGGKGSFGDERGRRCKNEDGKKRRMSEWESGRKNRRKSGEWRKQPGAVRGRDRTAPEKNGWQLTKRPGRSDQTRTGQVL